MKWIVFYHNINADRVETCNVFDHGGFSKEVLAYLKKCKTKEDFAVELRRSLFYYFGSKCEWEILISPWCGSRNQTAIKVDVYHQVMNNWGVFVDYVWSNRKGSKKQ